MPNLEVAFLNIRKNFNGAQASCAGFGAGWHAPASIHFNANPRATDNSNSLEAVGEYFHDGVTTSRYHYFWSSSSVSNDTYYAWVVTLGYGYTSNLHKAYSDNVVCVRP